MKLRLVLAFALVCGVILLMGATPASAAESGGTFRLGATEPTTLDPARITFSNEFGIAQQIMEGLTGLDQDLNVVPAVAESWTPSPDAKTWTFHLRHDVYFHNGRQAAAKDFVYSWNRAKNAGGMYASMFDNIASFSAADKFTFVVNLVNANSGFPSQATLAIFAVIPKEAAASIAVLPVGTGPFKFVKWTPGKQIVLARNAAYYGDVPYLKGIAYHFYTDGTFAAEWADFQAGKLELTRIPVDQWAAYKNDPNTITSSMMYARSIGFKMSAFPDLNLRKALQRSINRAALAANSAVWAFDPGLQVAHGVVSPGKGSYDNSDITVPYDPDAALAFFAAAGWTDTNADGFLDDGAGTDFGVTIPDSTSTSYHAYYQAIADQLTDIGGKGVGMHVTMNATSSAQTMLNLGWISDYPDAENDLLAFETNGPYASRIGYSSAAFDNFLATGRATLDGTARNAAFHSADAQVVLNDAAVLPVYYGAMNPVLKKPYVHDLEITPQGSSIIAFKGVWLTQPPPKPELLIPTNGAVLTTKKPLLDWTGKTVAGTNYNLAVRLNKPNGAVVADLQLADSKYKVTTPLAKKTYFWRVQACNAERCSAWSAWWSFTVQ